jgi:3-deoxy-D-manno-octulosonic-acid transferase
VADGLPLPLSLYRAASAAAAPLAGAIARRRLKVGKEDSARLDERRGVSALARPDGPLVWIHGASVGEVLAAAALVERLREIGVRVLLTSGTTSSAAIVASRFPADVIHQFIPYDSPRFVERFLDHWRPSFALFVESDLWPNLVLCGAERRIPMIVINGRMSQHSFRRWRMAPMTIATLLQRFEMCLAQSQDDADRFSALGSPHVFTTGNLKFDVEAPPADDVRLSQLATALRGRQVLVAASTHPGEDEIVIDAHRRLATAFPSLLSVIVPRHPKRGESIAQLAGLSGLRVGLRSRNELPTAETDIYVADTLGELGLFYRLAPVVFMGGSLVDHGGQNPIEAIKLGAAILHGPFTANFSDVYATLDAAGGAGLSADGEDLIKRAGALLADADARGLAAQSAQRVVDALGGAVERTLAALEPYLLQLRIEQGANSA